MKQSTTRTVHASVMPAGTHSMRRGVGAVMVLAVIATAMAPGRSALAQSLTGLGSLPGYTESIALGVSPDGSVVVGAAGTSSGWNHAIRWTRQGGMQDISVPGRFAQAHAVSGDGTVVVGQGDPDGGGDGAFRWTQAGGMVRLTMPPGWYGSSAEGVSADGSVVAGLASNVQDGGGRAFRWTNAGVGGGTVEILGTLPTTCDPSYAESVGGISADGSVIAGDSTIDSASCNGHAFRWISDGLGGGTIEDLGVLPYQYASQSVSYGLSANGAVVVGQGDTDDYPQAFRWTSATGMQDIGLALTGSISHPSFASGANADGSVVVGYYDSVAFHDDRPLLWTTALGSVDLQEHLASLGVDTTEWSLQFAQGVSADGLTIVGWGLHNGHHEGWVADLHPSCGSADLNCDGDVGTDADIEAFFACIAGTCPTAPCTSNADFNGDGDTGTDADIEAFFRVLAGGPC